MLKYAARRLAVGLIVLIAISMLDFLFISLAPGDPLQAILPPEASPRGIQRLYAQNGFGDSLPVRYLRWLAALSRGNLGTSFLSGQETTTLLSKALPATLLLTGSAMVLSLAIGVPLGVLSAMRERSKFDTIGTIATFILTSIPGFFLALLAVFFLAIRLSWFPPGGMHAYDKKGDFADLLRHLVLPMVVLGVLNTPNYSRYVRQSILDVARQDYVRTARAKGMPEGAVVWKHIMPNALSPLITILGLSLPGLIGSSVLVEQVFAWPGMGTLSINAALYRDYPVFMGASLLYASAVLVSNLLADLAYGLADPRIRLA